jgi:hypothetical protein
MKRQVKVKREKGKGFLPLPATFNLSSSTFIEGL